MKKTLLQLYSEHEGKVSDKWALYLREYDRLFSEYRESPVKILEIGIQNGGALEIWPKYFTNLEKLIGCDINPACKLLEYNDPRIFVFVADANSAETVNKILNHAPAFDLIIDDGSHRSSDIIASFVNYFPSVSDGGMFVVEDIHCSYWYEFEGGLYFPYSSINFFKRLADVVNYEHWGVEKSRDQILAGILTQYGLTVSQDILSTVHSVEFINSICVIRKSKPSYNVLGERNIVGTVALVENEVVELRENAKDPESRFILSSRTPNQSENIWSSRSEPPDEELIHRLAQIDILEKKINELTIRLHETENCLTNIYESSSWRLTYPLRQIGKLLRRVFD